MTTAFPGLDLLENEDGGELIPEDPLLLLGGGGDVGDEDDEDESGVVVELEEASEALAPGINGIEPGSSSGNALAGDCGKVVGGFGATGPLTEE